jgi:hypothetical protein
MKASVKKKAVLLRSQGYSYNLISSKLGVSKSTLHYWLADRPYRANSVVLERIIIGRERAAKTKNRKKLLTFKEASSYARTNTGRLSSKELLMLGIGLYIGEGQKNETVGVINSDPRVINLAIHWLTECFGVEVKNLTLAIHLYPDNNIKRCLRFWSDTTKIPPAQFGKTQIDGRVGKTSLKRGKLPYGTAHLRVKALGNKDFGVVLSRRIHALMHEVLKTRA